MEHTQRLFLLHSVLGAIVSVRAEGVERIPGEGGVILVCNHSDLIDPVIQGLYSGRGLCYLAKAELLGENPRRRFERFYDRARRLGVPDLMLTIFRELLEVVLHLLEDARILPIVRGYRTGSAAGSVRYYEDIIENVTRLLERGEAVVIYPEGSRSVDGKLQKFRGLAARIALRARVPIVPTALVGAFGFSDLNQWVNASNTRRSIVYRVGEPIRPENFARGKRKKDAIKELTRKLQTDVAELLQRQPLRPKSRRARKTTARATEERGATRRPETAPAEPPPEPRPTRRSPGAATRKKT